MAWFSVIVDAAHLSTGAEAKVEVSALHIAANSGSQYDLGRLDAQAPVARMSPTRPMLSKARGAMFRRCIGEETAMNDRIRFYDRALRRLSRRELLNVAWKLGAAAVLSPIASSSLLAQPKFRSYPFTLGVASGEPAPDGAVLWTRLAPEPLEGGGMLPVSNEVGWEVARDAAFRSVVSKGTAIARPELGHSVHVEVSGLESGREYFYRFHVGSETSQTGRAVTAPPLDGSVDRLRFAVCGCDRYENRLLHRLSSSRE